VEGIPRDQGVHNSVEIGFVVGGSAKRFHANGPFFQAVGVTGERLLHHEAEKVLAALARAKFRARQNLC